MEQEGEEEDGGLLACNLYKRGQHLAEQGWLPAAVADLKQALAIFTRLVEGGCKTLTTHLVLTLALWHRPEGSGQAQEALAAFEKAVGICTHLVEQKGWGEDFVGLLASSLNDRSTVLRELGSAPRGPRGSRPGHRHVPG